MRQVYAIIELARFCQAANVTVDMEVFYKVYESYVDEIKHRGETFTHPAVTHTFSRAIGNQIRTLKVHGGVEFTTSSCIESLSSLSLTSKDAELLHELYDEVNRRRYNSSVNNIINLKTFSTSGLCIPIIGQVHDCCETCYCRIIDYGHEVEGRKPYAIEMARRLFHL